MTRSDATRRAPPAQGHEPARLGARVCWGPTFASRGQRGLTLLEVMIAMAVLALALGATVSLTASAHRSADLAGRYTRATILAERLLAEAVAEDAPPAAREPRPEEIPDAPGFRAMVRGEPWGDASVLRLTVTVEFDAPGGPRQVVLETLRAPRKVIAWR